MINLDQMSDAEVLAYAQRQMPMWRKLLSRTKSFLNGLLGRGRSVAIASEKININDMADGHLRKTGTITLSRFKAPSFRKLKNAFNTLQQSDEIDNMENTAKRLSRATDPAVKQGAKSIIAIVYQMVEAYNEAMDLIESVAEASLPQEVADVVKEATAAANAIVQAYTDKKGTVDLSEGSNLLIGAEDDRIDFCLYLNATEWVDKRMYVIVTCSLTTVGNEWVMSRHVTIQERFQAPMHYDFGVATTDIAKSIRFAMAAEGVIAVMGTVKLTNVDHTRITNALKPLPFYKSVEFEDKAIHVYVKNNKKVATQEKELFTVMAGDTDIRSLIGRTKRLFSEWNEDHWTFTVASRS